MKYLAIIILMSMFAFGASRPTNDFEIIYDNNLHFIIEADNVDDALAKFRREVKANMIYSVARRSYVQSIWIWIN